MPDTYTIKGRALSECSLDDLLDESDAAHWFMAQGWTGSFNKLHAVEDEIRRREAHPEADDAR